MTDEFRIEKDSMGEVKVPKDALYAAQTQRAVDNFPVSGIPIRRPLIAALGMIKSSAARVNGTSGAIPEEVAALIQSAAQEVIEGKLDEHFPIDIYQTGSGTSSNMNANEVIANRASQLSAEKNLKVHPNDHVNCGQSSNDTFPTAIRIAAVMETQADLIPALKELIKAFQDKGSEYAHVVKTGRTHLMDAMPVTLEQEFGGYARQLELGIERPLNPEFQLTCISPEFLLQGHRHCIHQMRPPGFDHMGVFRPFILECLDQLLQSRDQIRLSLHHRGNTDRSREGVVGALTTIDMVIGMNLQVFLR